MRRYFGKRGFFYARNVRARNAHFLCNLALCERFRAEKPVAQTDYFSRAAVKALHDDPFGGGGAHGDIEIVGNRILYAYDIAVGKRVALFIRIYSFAERDLAGAFLCERKYMSISFCRHLPAYVAKRAPFFGLKESIAFISPIVPMEMRSSWLSFAV